MIQICDPCGEPGRPASYAVPLVVLLGGCMGVVLRVPGGVAGLDLIILEYPRVRGAAKTLKLRMRPFFVRISCMFMGSIRSGSHF